VVLDFFDRLKSVSRGFASMDYQFARYQASDLIRLDIQINQEFNQYVAPPEMPLEECPLCQRCAYASYLFSVYQVICVCEKHRHHNTWFIIQNFRTFKEIKISKLAKVNLFLGKNSVGKTALLEAFYIYYYIDINVFFIIKY
jgi:hypothetical protein